MLHVPLQKQVIHDQLFIVERLNNYSSEKRNFFILKHLGDKSYQWVVDSKLSTKFNIITIFYDIHNSYKIEGFAENFRCQLIALIEPYDNCIVMGHSFNGYLAHQLACIIPQISFCILIDAYNFFRPEDQDKIHGLKKVLKIMIKHIFRNNDFAYPLYLPAMLVQNLKNKYIKDEEFFKGMDYLKSIYVNSPSLNNCIYFQAGRSRAGMNNHGLSWRPFVRGDFYLININEDHINILEKNSALISNRIWQLC